MFRYSNSISNSIANFTNNLKEYILGSDELNNYKNIFRSISYNETIIQNMDYETKDNLKGLINDLYEPANNYYDKYIKNYEDSSNRLNQSINKSLNLNDNIEYTYHLNKFNNMISNIDFSIELFIKDYERSLSVDSNFEFCR